MSVENLTQITEYTMVYYSKLTNTGILGRLRETTYNQKAWVFYRQLDKAYFVADSALYRFDFSTTSQQKSVEQLRPRII